MEKPFVLPIKTALGTYIYEINRNEIINEFVNLPYRVI